MKKAVPVALVLIAGAAVVLWFGDRLNSWVLGGLIGGLASLLLSIPISLALFSYLGRQHDEREQYMSVSHKRLRSGRSTLEPDYLPDEADAGYYDDEYGQVEGEVSTIVEEYYDPPVARRNSGWLDEEFGSPLPPARQLPPAASVRHTTRNVPDPHFSTPYGSQQRKTTPPIHQAGNEEEEYKTRKTLPRRSAYPGLPGSQQASPRTRFRSNALHTARLEARQQYIEENDLYLEDANPPSRTRSKRGREPLTDHLLSDSYSASEDTRSRPLQRRASYMYEDDEIQQDVPRYREAPQIRRASRYIRHKNED